MFKGRLAHRLCQPSVCDFHQRVLQTPEEGVLMTDMEEVRLLEQEGRADPTVVQTRS